MFSVTARQGIVPQDDAYIRMSPKFTPKNDALVGMVHAAGAYASDPLQASIYRQSLLTRQIASRYAVFSGDNGGPQTWGNPTSVQALQANLAYTQTDPKVSDSVYALIGNSMGGLVALNHTAQATLKPQAIVCVIPVVNTQDIVTGDRGGYAYLVNDAYPGGYSDSIYGQTSNPFLLKDSSKLADIPMLIIYGTKDTVCLPEYTEAFIQADSARHGVAMNYGHEYALYNAVDHNLIVDFINQHIG